MEVYFSASFLALLKVIAIDLTLAGDNAVVIGLAAAGLAPAQRGKAIVAGMAAATVVRVAFASITVQMLEIVGILFVGGLLLLWVCWKMWRELRENTVDRNAAQEALSGVDIDGNGIIAGGVARKTFRQAAFQIVVADVSMSLDNVLAVAGAAREHPVIMVFGLVFSIGLMGLAASLIARLLDRYRWLAYIGLAIIFYVALDMIYRGTVELLPPVPAAMANPI